MDHLGSCSSSVSTAEKKKAGELITTGEIQASVRTEATAATIPEDLADLVRAELATHIWMSWDDAITQIAMDIDGGAS